MSEPPSPVLVVVAHPDDIDFGTAGTIARLTDSGAEVVYALVTNGEAGPPEDEPDRQKVAEVRQREQAEAGKQVGVTDIRWLGHADGRVTASLELRRDISRVIRQVRPELVITQSPQRRWDRIYASHPDHLAVAEATMAAVYPDARNPWAHTDLLDDEGLEPHSVARVWIGMLDEPDVYIDITDVFDRKVAALRSHQSQTGWIPDLDALLREWAAGTTSQFDLPEGRLTEAFRQIETA
ncbi:MAG: PIG-L family deacetylase [Acidimicrobiia bacterium]|nr:PIG-L family deacetylase [Acidimicrobiia bacterium]